MRPGFYLRVFLSSILLILSFPRPDVGVLSLFALVPLFSAISGATLRRAFAAGWGAGTLWFFVSYNWVSHSITVFGNIPLLPAEGIILLLAGIHGLYVAFFAMLVPLVAGGRVRVGVWERGSVGDKTRKGKLNQNIAILTRLLRHSFTPIIILPSAWVLLEVMRSWIPAPFPWLLMGSAAWKFSLVTPLYALAGVHGVSFWILIINTIIWIMLRERGSVRWGAGITLILLLCMPAVLSQVRGTVPGQNLRIGIVQGNFKQEIKWEEDQLEETLETYLALSEEAAKRGARLVIWPETAVPSFYQSEPELIERLRRFTSKRNIHLIFGSPGYEIREREVLLYNRVYHLPPGGGEEYYDKIMLVPFGEYVPFAGILPFVEKMVPGEGEFARGAWKGPFHTPAPTGALICYEVSIPSLARNEVRDGASILVNVTNDAWFGRSWGPYQHLAVSAVRAMENSVPVLRAANTGISAVIDQSGQIAETIALGERGIIVRDIDTGGGLTPYARLGDWIVILCAAVISVYCFVSLLIWRSRKWTR